MNRNGLYTLAGAALTLTSLVGIASALSAKKKGYLLAVTLGLAGLAAGIALATQPERTARRGLTVDELLDEGDVARLQKNISEILGEAPV